MCRLWAWAALLVLITGVGLVQGNNAVLEITSMTIDTSNSELVVCFTYDDDEVLDQNYIRLMCWINETTPDQILLHTTSLNDAQAPNYCSTHTILVISSTYGNGVNCVMDIIKDEVPLNISGSAEFVMPGEDQFPTCEKAYRWIDQKLVGVVCSHVGSFDNAFFDLQPAVLVTNRSDGLNYILYADDTGDSYTAVSLCTMTTNTALDSPGELNICIPEITLATPTTDLKIKGSQLTYGSPAATLSVEVNTTEPTNDLVVVIDNTIIAQQGSSQPLSTSIPGYKKGTGSNFLVVNYNTDVLHSVSESIEDYELILMPLTSNTLELTWSFSDVTNKYTIERDGTEPSFTKATVECPGPSLCYGYFVDLTAEHSYTCSVSNDGEINKITDTSPQMPADTKDFSVKQLNLIWNREVNAAAATVCVDINYEVKDAEEASYHQLIMINSQGQVLKTQQVVQKTESLLCFEGVHLETSTFDVSRGKVTMVVVKRRADGHTILARGQSELFFISPEMGRVGGQAGRVSWKNPGGYSFTARREGQLAPLSTSTNGSLVHYFIPKATGPKDVLVVETEAADVKMTVVVPLTPRVTPGM